MNFPTRGPGYNARHFSKAEPELETGFTVRDLIFCAKATLGLLAALWLYIAASGVGGGR